jgi:hypothetical protein
VYAKEETKVRELCVYFVIMLALAMPAFVLWMLIACNRKPKTRPKATEEEDHFV